MRRRNCVEPSSNFRVRDGDDDDDDDDEEDATPLVAEPAVVFVFVFVFVFVVVVVVVMMMMMFFCSSRKFGSRQIGRVGCKHGQRASMRWSWGWWPGRQPTVPANTIIGRGKRKVR
jgi:hypothetical protein